MKCLYLIDCWLEIVFEPVKHERFKVLVDARVPETMSLRRVELDLMRLIEPHQVCCQRLRVLEVNILINETMRDEQPIFTESNAINKVESEKHAKAVIVNIKVHSTVPVWKLIHPVADIAFGIALLVLVDEAHVPFRVCAIVKLPL